MAELRGDVSALHFARESSDPQLRAVGLAGLGRLDALTPEDLTSALHDPSPAVRCRAIEIAIPFTAIDLIHLLKDTDDLVVETAAWALGERQCEDETTITALCKIATDHEVSICREAAVAALGAIGSSRGLSTILGAMTDRAPVRRRAVLALAPFDTDEVTAALEAALTDRDRQVRQAAEDLLG